MGFSSFIGLLAASVACGVLMVSAAQRRPLPVIDLELLRSRTFSGAFAASILYYAGLQRLRVLSAVEFLTGVWHYSAVDAGLAIAPGPLDGAAVRPSRRTAADGPAWRPGRVAAIGCAVNAGAQLLWLTQIQPQPAYLTHLLPAQLLGGAGVGLAIPSLLGAGSASLPRRGSAPAAESSNPARQVGTVLGVAGLVAILSRVSPTNPIPAFRSALVIVIAFFVAGGVVSAALLTARPVTASRPAAPVGPQDAGDEPIKTLRPNELR